MKRRQLSQTIPEAKQRFVICCENQLPKLLVAWTMEVEDEDRFYSQSACCEYYIVPSDKVHVCARAWEHSALTSRLGHC